MFTPYSLFSTCPMPYFFALFFSLFFPGLTELLKKKKLLHFVTTFFWRNYFYPSKVYLFNLMLQTTLKDGKCSGRKKEISCCLLRPLSAPVPPSHLALVSRALPGSNMLHLSLSLSSPHSCLLPLLGAVGSGQVQSSVCVQDWPTLSREENGSSSAALRKTLYSSSSSRPLCFPACQCN